MINPEYKVVNNSIFLPEGGSGLKSKTRIKFIQEKDGVALYDGGACVEKKTVGFPTVFQFSVESASTACL